MDSTSSVKSPYAKEAFSSETVKLLQGLPILFDQVKLSGQISNCKISKNGVTIMYTDGRLDFFQMDLTPVEIFLIEILPSIEQNIIETIKLAKPEATPWIHISKFMEIFTLFQTKKNSLLRVKSHDHFYGSNSSSLNSHSVIPSASLNQNQFGNNAGGQPINSSSFLSIPSLPDKTMLRESSNDLLGSCSSLGPKICPNLYPFSCHEDELKYNNASNFGRKPFRKLNTNCCKTLPCLQQDNFHEVYTNANLVNSDILASDPLNNTAIHRSYTNSQSSILDWKNNENIPPVSSCTNLANLPVQTSLPTIIRAQKNSFQARSSNQTLYCKQNMSAKLCRKIFMNTTSFGGYGDENNELKEPNGIVVLSDGTIIISDGNAQAIKFFTSTGQFLFSWQTQNSCHTRAYPTCLSYYDPGDLTLANIDTSKGGLVVVLRRPNPSVQLFTLSGRLIREICKDIENPKAVCVDHEGNIIVLESHVMLVSIHSWLGARESRFLCSTLQFPMSVTVDKSKRIYIADNLLHSIYIYDYVGNLLSKFGGPGLTNYPISVCYLSQPSSSFIDCLEEYIVVVDNHTNLNVTVFNLSGKVVFAMQSIKKHSQIFAATLDKTQKVRIGSSCQILNNESTKNSILFTSKDFHIYRYPLPSSLGQSSSPSL